MKTKHSVSSKKVGSTDIVLMIEERTLERQGLWKSPPIQRKDMVGRW